MRKKVVLVLISLVIVLCTIFFIFMINYNIEKKQRNQQELLLNEIKSHYNEFVITNRKTTLYKKENNNYIKAGEINKNVKILLDKIDINYTTKYFFIKNLNLYIDYRDVNKIDKYSKESRYNNYIYFNYNIITKSKTSFYNVNNSYLYTIDNSFDFKVIVEDNDRYGIIFNDELLFVQKSDVEKRYDSNNTTLKNKSKIMTLTYHFLYDEKKDSCDQSICQSLSQFESHLKYIRDNNYFSLKLFELEWYLDGKIKIPEKSIVLTIDDGTIFDEEAIKLLEKYDVNATLFVITSWIKTDNLKSNNLDLESHTHNMHNQYECPGYGNQGGGILCLSEEYILNDLKTSQDKLNGSKYLAYPFFDFNERAISLLKQSGFKLAFIGQYDSNGYSYPNFTDKYKVRRKTIFSTTTMEEFISYLK